MLEGRRPDYAITAAERTQMAALWTSAWSRHQDLTRISPGSHQGLRQPTPMWKGQTPAGSMGLPSVCLVGWVIVVRSSCIIASYNL